MLLTSDIPSVDYVSHVLSTSDVDVTCQQGNEIDDKGGWLIPKPSDVSLCNILVLRNRPRPV
jgi:hypothetical protein